MVECSNPSSAWAWVAPAASKSEGSERQEFAGSLVAFVNDFPQESDDLPLLVLIYD